MSEAAEAYQFATVSTAEERSDGLRDALLESRQRWRQFGALATDLAFETDAEGLLTFVAPELVLGWPSTELVGQPARLLLLDGGGTDIFASASRQERRPSWFRNRAGEAVCMAVSAVPMRDAAGRVRGTRGVAVNVTEQERASTASAAALRRGEVMDHILGRMRQEVLAPRMMQAMLDALLRALGGTGAAVMDLLEPDPAGDGGAARHVAGVGALSSLQPVRAAFAAVEDGVREVRLADGTACLACPCSTRFGERAALTVWRRADLRGWDADDTALIASVSGLVRMVLEHDSIQRELARQARTDPLTGLLNRRAFLEEARRRLDRLEREGACGTLMFLDLDRLKQLNDRRGHEAGDAALVLISTILLRVFRPGDLVARLGGDEFAVWMDGADSLTAAERAEELRHTVPGELAHLTDGETEGASVSIGIATRDAGTDETLEQMIQRADEAMYQVKRSERGQWRVSRPDGMG